MANLPMILFYKNRDYTVGSIKFDLLLSENHNRPNTVTKYKIEDGSTMTDFIYNEVFTGNITGLITNFSIFDGYNYQNKSQEAFDTLEQLWRDKQPVTINTVLKVYEDIAITNISCNRDSNTGEALQVQISFQEMKIVKLQDVLLDTSITIKTNNTSSTINKQISPNKNMDKTVGNDKFNIQNGKAVTTIK